MAEAPSSLPKKLASLASQETLNRFGGYVSKHRVPANPETVSNVRTILLQLKAVELLYFLPTHGCEKSMRTVSAIYRDAYLYLTHLTYDRPGGEMDSFATEEDSKRFMFNEIVAYKLLCKTPNFASLRRPRGSNAWTKSEAESFETSKSEILKCWSKLKSKLLEKFQATDMLETADDVCKDRFKGPHYKKEK